MPTKETRESTPNMRLRIFSPDNVRIKHSVGKAVDGSSDAQSTRPSFPESAPPTRRDTATLRVQEKSTCHHRMAGDSNSPQRNSEAANNSYIKSGEEYDPPLKTRSSFNLHHLCTKCGHDQKANAENKKLDVSRPFVLRSLERSTSRGSNASSSQIRSKSLCKFDRTVYLVKEAVLDGKSIADYYDINLGTLGKGSYGCVAKAKDLRTGVLRAAKIVYKPKIENIARLKREIDIMKRLDHPNIIKLFEVFEDQNNLYLILEMCSGGELFDRIVKSGGFSEEYAANIIKQLLSAIRYCHANGIMHRDIKPENLLFSDESQSSSLKVIDWGFAAMCDKNHKFTSVVGTPYYVAPEVLYGHYDQACDLWSAGVILYILLCGYPPFRGKDNKEILRKVKTGEYAMDPVNWKLVSNSAKSFVQGLMTYDPRKRLTSADALQHPWIIYNTQSSNNASAAVTTKLAKDLFHKFKVFHSYNKMKKIAATCIAYQLSVREIGYLYDCFQTLDKNGDGSLSVSELISATDKMNIKCSDGLLEVLDQIDTDGNGRIDYTEFVAASIDQKLFEQEGFCKAAFTVMDLDGNGKIDIDELRQLLDNSDLKEAFKDEQIEGLMKEFDLNNDGFIDFNEFMRMMRGNQKRKLEKDGALSKARAMIFGRFEK